MLLDLKGVSSGYGAAQILQAISLHVVRGEVVALLGRNGAGKSTTMKTIAGLIAANAGTIHFEQTEVTNLPAYRIARTGIGYVPEDRRIFTNLTVEENLEVGRKDGVGDAHRWTLEEIWELFPNLASMRSRLGSRMSGGEQQMLTIARTLMGNPTLLLLDEPSEGLAPRLVETMGEAILRLKQSGLSILLSEQNIHFADRITDRVYVIEKGSVAYDGSIVAFRESRDVHEKYLAV